MDPSMPDFPHVPGVDRSKVVLTEEGRYSYTHARESAEIARLIADALGRRTLRGVRIQDLTANVGGDTIALALRGAKVRAVELNPENLEALRANVRLYDLGDRVTIHHADSTKWYGRYRADALLIDGPWGGSDYKLKKSLDLFLSGINIGDFVRDTVLAPDAPWCPAVVALKVPANFNFASLAGMSWTRHRVRNYFLVLVKPT
jgi:predicted RNA methylase